MTTDADDGLSPVLVGVDAGATKAVAIATATDGERLARAEGPGANPKRHGLDAAADRIAALAGQVAGELVGQVDPVAARSPSCSSPARASIDRSTPARSREPCAGDLPRTRA